MVLREFGEEEERRELNRLLAEVSYPFFIGGIPAFYALVRANEGNPALELHCEPFWVTEPTDNRRERESRIAAITRGMQRFLDDIQLSQLYPPETKLSMIDTNRTMANFAMKHWGFAEVSSYHDKVTIVTTLGNFCERAVQFLAR